MPLSIGDKLGPYKILAGIGAGGMDESIKARDLRLDHTVVLKVFESRIHRTLHRPFAGRDRRKEES